MRKALLLLTLSITLFHCTDPVDLPSRFEEPELVVEPWLTNKPEPQTILLTESQDYYDNRLPTLVTGAQVIVCETQDGTPTSNCFVFEDEGEGRYVWTPAPGETIGEVGMEFGLGIQRGDKQYASVTSMNRTALLDSISFQFEEASLGLEEGIYAQIFARDQVGIGDAYLIRTTINDTLLLRPFELNVAFDATFDPGTETDGITFIFPIRFSINKTDDNGAQIPLQEGEKVAVEIWSLSPEAYFFLSVAGEQVINGGSGLFDIPVVSSPGNVFDVDSGERVLGVFNVAAVVAAERTVGE